MQIYSIQYFIVATLRAWYLFNARLIFLNVMWNIFLHRPNKIEVTLGTAGWTCKVIWINWKWEKKKKKIFFNLERKKCIFNIRQQQNFFYSVKLKKFIVKILSLSFPYSAKMLEKRRICVGIHEFTDLGGKTEFREDLQSGQKDCGLFCTIRAGLTIRQTRQSV